MVYIKDVTILIAWLFIHSSTATFMLKNKSLSVIDEKYYRFTYSIISCITIIVAGILWEDSNIVLYSFNGSIKNIFIFINLLGWMMYFYCHIMYYEVGSVFGVYNIFYKLGIFEQPRTGFSTNGLRKYIRFPVHTAFWIIFLSIPTVTTSTFLFIIIGCLYSWLGSFFHDKRYLFIFKDDYRNYKNNSMMVFTNFKKSVKTPRSDGIKRFEAIKMTTPVIPIIVISSYIFLYIGINNEHLGVIINILFYFMVSAIISIFFFIQSYIKISNRNMTTLQRSIAERYYFLIALNIAIFSILNYTGEYILTGGISLGYMIIPSWILSLVLGQFIFGVLWKIKFTQKKEFNHGK